jgi:predicted aconitase
MRLTSDQQALLDGAEGPVLAKCMRTLVRYGAAFGAPRLVPIASAHLTGSFKIFFYTAYYEIVRQLVEAGVRVRVPTTLNPRPGYDYRPQNRILFRSQRWHEQQLEALGVTPNYSCVCYEYANIPGFGDVLGWAESSAVIFANSVIGARSNRNSIMVDICQAVTGLTPEFGYLLDENRRGQLLVDVSGITRMDAPALGFLIGRLAVDRVPVLTHWPFDRAQLKNLGAAMASSGSVTMFHVVGLTPEAPDLATAFGGREPPEVHRIAQRDLESIRSTAAEQQDAGVIAFGCPQMTLAEAAEIGRHFVGRRVRKPVLFHMIPQAAEEFSKLPLYQEVLRAGVEVHTHCPLAGLSLRIGVGNVLTPSGKLYYYLQGTRYGSVDEVLRAAGVVD